MRTVQEERDRISFGAKLVRLMLLAAWAWIIIGLSGQQGEDSAGLSLLVSRALADMLLSLKMSVSAVLWLDLESPQQNLESRRKSNRNQLLYRSFLIPRLTSLKILIIN